MPEEEKRFSTVTLLALPEDREALRHLTAVDGTIRKLYGANVGENAVHGSDSLENAAVEIAYFGLLPEFIGRGLGGALLTSELTPE